MTHSKFYASLVLLILLNAIIKPLWIFGVDRQVQNIIGVAEYGLYFSLLNLSIVFSFLLDWGLSIFINRELSAKKSALHDYLGTFVFLKFLFAVLYAAIVIAIAFITGVKRWDIVWGVILIQFLTFLFVFSRSVVTANQWFKTDALLSILDKSLMIIVCGGFILWPWIFGRMDIDKFLSAQIFCTCIAVCVCIAILLFRGIKFKALKFRLLNRSIINSILPFAITIFLMSMHVRLDGFLLERLHSNGQHEAGIYAAAYRLLDASNMVGYLIASFLLPFVARLWSETKPLGETILQTRHLLIMFTVTMISITWMLAPWLQKILYHRGDVHGIAVLQWTILALIGYSFVQIYGTVMTATGNIVSFCYFNLIAVIVNVVLNLILIPLYGALGCSISAVISQFFLGIATLTFVHKKFNFPAGMNSVGIYFFSTILLCAIMYLFIRNGMNELLLIPIVVILTFLIMWFTKMINLKTWLNFLKKQ